jgi:hypothetical protein
VSLTPITNPNTLEKRAALDAWARHIEGLMSNDETNIIELAARQ